jgi:hypothetical protein
MRSLDDVFAALALLYSGDMILIFWLGSESQTDI